MPGARTDLDLEDMEACTKVGLKEIVQHLRALRLLVVHEKTACGPASGEAANAIKLGCREAICKVPKPQFESRPEDAPDLSLLPKKT